MLGSKIPSPVPGGSPRQADPSNSAPTPTPSNGGLPAHNPDYEAKRDLHMQAIDRAARNLAANPNPNDNPLQLKSDQDDDTLPYRYVLGIRD